MLLFTDMFRSFVRPSWSHLRIPTTHNSCTKRLTTTTRCYGQFLKHSLWSWIVKLYCS